MARLGRRPRLDSAWLRAGLRFEDARFHMAFARLAIHYWSNAEWREKGGLLRDAHELTGIPAVLVHSQLDISSPLDVP